MRKAKKMAKTPKREAEEEAPGQENEMLGLIQLDENLSDIEKPPDVPPGPYIAEVQDVQIGHSAAGNDYFSVRFVIPADELPADVREHYEDGAILFWNRNIVPKSGSDRRALFNLRKLVESLGLPTNTSAVDPNEWMGRKARLQVRAGQYLGETRAEIASVGPAESGPATRAAVKRPPRR
jgi:hypothetical protein